MKQIFEKNIDRAVTLLKKQQLDNGSFLSYSSPSQNNFSKAVPYNTIFTNALILSSLQHLDNPKSKFIQNKIARFLLSEKSPHWTFNYWSKSAPEYKNLPYPDDLDDTFCALAALFTFDKSLITGEVLASVIHILTSLEVDEGGPYKTWIVEDTADKIWQDVDLAVNANIGYFLALNKIDLPNITTFIENALKNSTYTSPYYPTPYPILYFISRWYSGELKEKAIDDILKNQGKDCWGNPINASCAVSTLLRFGYDPGKLSAAAQYISDSLEKPESHAFYTGINPKRDKTFFAGSPSLTITLSIEALSLYNEYMKLTQQSKPHPSPFAHLHKATLEFIDSRINKTSPEVQHVMTAYTNKLRKTDNDVKIILLPYLFYKSIHTQKKLPDDFFIKLGAANLYGWIAYTIYDDFLDEEGNPQHLPAANICLRELTSIFESVLPENPEFKTIFHNVLDKIDDANAWETSFCRISTNKILPGNTTELPDFKDLSQLAHKSLGHALGPLAILLSQGYAEKNVEWKNTITFFKNYLIARQLNDDAHDWEHDLKKGQLNAVSVLVLKDAQMTSLKNLDFEKLNNQFWTQTIITIALTMLNHIKKARAAIKSSPVIKDKTLFENLLIPIEQSAKKVITEQKKAQEFIAAYKS